MDEVMKINIEKLKETRNENKANYEDRIRKEAIKVANNIIKQVCNDFASYTEKQNYTTVKVRIDKDEDKNTTTLSSMTIKEYEEGVSASIF